MTSDSNWTDAGEPDVDAESLDQDDDQDTAPDDADRGQLIAENKRYRARAQEAEAARDALSARLERAQTAQIASMASDLAEPTDLLSTAVGGRELADLLDEDGHVDPVRVRETVSGILASRPGLASTTASPAHFPDAGQFGKRRAVAKKTGKSWADVIAPKRGIGPA